MRLPWPGGMPRCTGRPISGPWRGCRKDDPATTVTREQWADAPAHAAWATDPVYVARGGGGGGADLCHLPSGGGRKSGIGSGESGRRYSRLPTPPFPHRNAPHPHHGLSHSARAAPPQRHAPAVGPCPGAGVSEPHGASMGGGDQWPAVALAAGFNAS
jgi:hypothetical protein